MPTIAELEQRTAALPDPVKARLRNDADIKQALAQLAELTTKLAQTDAPVDASVDDLAEVENLRDDLIELWLTRLEQAEKPPVPASSPLLENRTSCPYCGAGLPGASPKAVQAWVRKHVERLHPMEWKAALSEAEKDEEAEKVVSGIVAANRSKATAKTRLVPRAK